MHIAIQAYPAQQKAIGSRNWPQDVTISWIDTEIPTADAYFFFGPITTEAITATAGKPVFADAVLETLASLPSNCSRINGWNTFLDRPALEVVLRDQAAANILLSLGWQYNVAPDVPGMISARTIAMILNEAYFALGEGVSTKEDIDTAMKLGTNYPFGPFEWSERIGLVKIYHLLIKLSATDSRYQPAPALEQELKSIA